MPLTVHPVATSHDRDVPVRNGVYTVTYDGNTSSWTFKVHTITSARTEDLIGKRVISRMASNGGYQAFGFITTAGDLRLWQRFSDDENAPYVKAARLMLSYWANEPRSFSFNRGMTDWVALIDGESINGYYKIEFGLMCRVCNGRVRDHDEMIYGIHFNGVCTDELSPAQVRDQEARERREREAVALRERQAQEVAALRSMRASSHSGVAPGVPDGIVARLPRSAISPGVVQ